MPAGSEGSTLDDYGPPRENDSSETIEAKGPPPTAPRATPCGDGSSRNGKHAGSGSGGGGGFSVGGGGGFGGGGGAR